MEEIELRFTALVEERKKLLPKSGGSASGMIKRLEYANKMIPELTEKMNVIIQEHISGRNLTEEEVKKIQEIHKTALVNYLK